VAGCFPYRVLSIISVRVFLLRPRDGAETYNHITTIRVCGLRGLPARFSFLLSLWRNNLRSNILSGHLQDLLPQLP
jgi:hypothetical protein